MCAPWVHNVRFQNGIDLKEKRTEYEDEGVYSQVTACDWRAHKTFYHRTDRLAGTMEYESGGGMKWLFPHLPPSGNTGTLWGGVSRKQQSSLLDLGWRYVRWRVKWSGNPVPNEVPTPLTSRTLSNCRVISSSSRGYISFCLSPS